MIRWIKILEKYIIIRIIIAENILINFVLICCVFMIVNSFKQIINKSGNI